MNTIQICGHFDEHRYLTGLWMLRSFEQSWLNGHANVRTYITTRDYSSVMFDEMRINASFIIEAGPFRWFFWPDEPMCLKAKGNFMMNFINEPKRQNNVIRHNVAFEDWPILAAEMLRELVGDNDFHQYYWSEHGNPKAQKVLDSLLEAMHLAHKVLLDDFEPKKPASDEKFARWPTAAIEGSLDKFSFQMFTKAACLTRQLKSSLLGNDAKIDVVVNADYESISAKIDYGLSYLYIDWSWGQYASGYVVLCSSTDDKPQLGRTRINLDSYDEIITAATNLLAEFGQYEISSPIRDLKTLISVIKAARQDKVASK